MNIINTELFYKNLPHFLKNKEIETELLKSYYYDFKKIFQTTNLIQNEIDRYILGYKSIMYNFETLNLN